MTAALITAFFKVSALALILERAMACVLELKFPQVPSWRRWWHARGTADAVSLKSLPQLTLGEWLPSFVKGLIAIGLSWSLVWQLELKLLAAFAEGSTGKVDALLDSIVTALVVSGGSAAAIKLFQDTLGLGKLSRDASQEAFEAEARARAAKASAEVEAARVARAKAEAEAAILEVHAAMNRMDVEGTK